MTGKSHDLTARGAGTQPHPGRAVPAARSPSATSACTVSASSPPLSTRRGPPAILAVGEAVRQPVVRDDQVTIGTTMMLTLSIDGRAVDGATAAGFLTRLRELIEQPLDIVF